MLKLFFSATAMSVLSTLAGSKLSRNGAMSIPAAFSSPDDAGSMSEASKIGGDANVMATAVSSPPP